MSVPSEELLERHRAAIRAVAVHVRATMRGNIELEELFQLGVQGMLESARRHDPSLGVAFWTFAYLRVRGTMVDAMRLSMPVPPRYHRRLRAAESALHETAPGTREHERAAQRATRAAETAGHFAPEALSIMRGETLGAHDVEPTVEEEESTDRLMRIDQLDAECQLETAQRAQAIHVAMRALTVEERMVVRAIYFEERGLDDVGAELGVSKSWACRINARALRRLQAALASEWDDGPTRCATSAT